MAEAKKGDTVKVHYTGKLKDGTVFDTSRDREPLEFKLGEGRIIPGFEKAVLGMSVGEEKTAQVESDEAYGPRTDEMVLTVDREKIPENIEPKVSQPIQIRLSNGETRVAQITHVTESSVTLDANHPLAGLDLTFAIELMEIVG
ncbi:MAG: peptidylprolyl isomerase [Candidatus Eisenbacteria bacterium]|nr:peptidylprolyl isomerase [Candidatus Latescibacterota bacterium]MBD3302707.1 peptidylprolyl isomerase [Candidatus Eisenbacteria bacterium]